MGYLKFARGFSFDIGYRTDGGLGFSPGAGFFFGPRSKVGTSQADQFRAVCCGDRLAAKNEPLTFSSIGHHFWSRSQKGYCQGLDTPLFKHMICSNILSNNLLFASLESVGRIEPAPPFGAMCGEGAQCGNNSRNLRVTPPMEGPNPMETRGLDGLMCSKKRKRLRACWRPVGFPSVKGGWFAQGNSCLVLLTRDLGNRLANLTLLLRGGRRFPPLPASLFGRSVAKQEFRRWFHNKSWCITGFPSTSVMQFERGILFERGT